MLPFPAGSVLLRTVHLVPAPAGAAGASTARRRNLGAFYTPPVLARHMAALLRDLTPTSRVLEPSGGDGAFLEPLITAGLAPQQIDVWDIDPAVEPTMRRAGVTFTRCDALLNPPVEPGPVFTHVIGNPPYLSKGSQYLRTHRTDLRKAYAAIGAHDTYAMFTYMALQRLAPGGQMVFLISDTFLTLGVHRKLREHLLTTTTLESLTLLPPGTFPGAAVRTVILELTHRPALDGHQVRFHDLRDTEPGTFTGGTTHHVPQADLATAPGAVLTFDTTHRQVLHVAAACPPLMGLLDGGLGMFTRDNTTYLAVISRDGQPAVPPGGLQVVDASEVDGVTWRAYHKRGGKTAWWAPAEHAVRWDPTSRAQYGIPTSALAGQHDDQPRPGLVVSGVSSRLTARLITPGAMWESNKAFGLFPKDPDTWPVEFFLAVLNSTWYDTCARALNHTVSLQMRDLRALPLLPFTPAEVARLAAMGRAAVAQVRTGAPVGVGLLRRIDTVVANAAARVH